MKPLVTAAMIQSVQIDDKLGPPSEQLAGALNAALEPLLAGWEAAILKMAADSVDHAERKYETESLCKDRECGCLTEWIKREILALSAPDALARHDAAVRLEEAKWWEHLVGNDPHAHSGDDRPCMYCERIAALKQAAGGQK
jgi:hypothetical protein